MERNLDLTILIPCLNEAETVGRAVEEALEGIRSLGVRGEVVVSDNGSTDGTQEIAERAGARVVHAPVRGYGAALHFGFLNARGRWVLFGDADLSYNFGGAAWFADALKDRPGQERFDLVLGSRLAGTIPQGAMPFLNRYVGTPALNLAIRFFFSLRTSDCNSGMRLVRTEFYHSLPVRSTGMEWASEVLILSAIKHARYSEVKIDFRKDQRSRPPHLRRWRDGWRHLKTIVLLSPNRLLAFPGVIALAICAWALAMNRPHIAIVTGTAGLAALSLALIIKLVLHGENIRTSDSIVFLSRKATMETLLASGTALVVLGAALLSSPRFSAAHGTLLLNAGMLALLTACAWGALLPHALNSLRAVMKQSGALKSVETKKHAETQEQRPAA